MSSMVRSLEVLAQMAVAPGASTQAAENAAGVSEQLAEILRAGDQQQLNALLGAATNVCCMVYPAKQDEDESEERESDDHDEDDDDGDAKGQLVGQRLCIGLAC